MSQHPRMTATEAMVPGAMERAGLIDAAEPRHANRGQVLILFALFLTGMLGVLGLSIDVGYAVSQRRMMQNAADLAAIAGALSIANYSDSNSISALTAVQNTVDGNQTHQGSPALEECNYVNDSLYEVASCDARVPADATGIAIVVRETHPTFFIRAIPGGATQVTTKARATARVERLFRAGMDAPFIVCGYGTKRMDGSTMDILLNNNFVNPAAVGQTFRVMGTSEPSSGEPQIADCGLEGIGAASWRGLADNSSSSPNNNGKELNQMWLGQNGTAPGTMKYNIQGLDGCQQGKTAPYSCVLLLPVFTDEAHGYKPEKEVGGPPRFQVVKVLGFVVSSCGAQCYQATLLDDYPTFGGSVPGWCRDCGAVTVIKLRE
jgi:Flp pilus assembly protein TadG